MKRQPSENSLVFQQATNDNRGEEESMPVALMILIPILSSGLILIILTVVCIRRKGCCKYCKYDKKKDSLLVVSLGCLSCSVV